MAKAISKLLLGFVLICVAAELSGCAALKKKLTPKKKPKPEQAHFTRVKKYEVKPSLELYKRHYIFWVNWHKKFIAELGENYKSDTRSMEEMLSNLEDMRMLLVDEKAAGLKPHIDEMLKAKAIIEERNLTKLNDTRIRRIVEKEFRNIRREFSPKKMADSIRKDWRWYW